MLRIRDDGSIPEGNAYSDPAMGKPEIWSKGQARNLQSATMEPLTGGLPDVEHGAKGGDELNGRKSARTMAGRHFLWRRLFGRQARYRHGSAGLRAASALLGSFHRAIRHGELHGRYVPRVKGDLLSAR